MRKAISSGLGLTCKTPTPKEENLLRIILCLCVPKLIVFAVAIDKQIGMAALLDDCTLVEHGDLVTKFAGGQSVRNEIRPPVY